MAVKGCRRRLSSPLTTAMSLALRRYRRARSLDVLAVRQVRRRDPEPLSTLSRGRVVLSPRAPTRPSSPVPRPHRDDQPSVHVLTFVTPAHTVFAGKLGHRARGRRRKELVRRAVDADDAAGRFVANARHLPATTRRAA
uniref:Uncharacterized protein n=3 Tax=Oryza sativa TaxID=4530 RepID=Q6Z8S9_ORYSJ|nr:hypothetical protein [Oryza sativa Japonica Group]